MEHVEYRPQHGLGTLALVRACVATAVAVILLALGIKVRAATYVAAFPAAVALVWFSAYARCRRLRSRLTVMGIESRRLQTRFIPWAQIRDVRVVQRVTVARVAVRGSRSSGRFSSRSGGGARKVAAIRIQQDNGRWRELALPVAWENAPDPYFTDKAGVIKDRWRAATGQESAN